MIYLMLFIVFIQIWLGAITFYARLKVTRLKRAKENASGDALRKSERKKTWEPKNLQHSQDAMLPIFAKLNKVDTL